MKRHPFSAALMAAGLLMAAPAFAQTTNAPSKQRTDGDAPTMVGPASKAYKQRTDGSGPTMLGPASGAYKQHTQSLSRSDGPASGSPKQN